MALSPMEMSEEERQQLNQLVKSPGWDLYVNHLQRLVRSRETVKAQHLRELKAEAAMVEQAKIDGMTDSLKLIQDILKKPKEPSEPHY